MASPQSRAPYPYDFRITINSVTYSLMLTRSKNDGIGWTENRVDFFPAPVSAESIDYNRYPPEDEMVYIQSDFSGGVGQATQPEGQASRYAWAEHVDASSGEAVLANAATESTTALAVPSRTAWTVPNAVRFGAGTIYFALYRYLYKWVEATATLTQVLDAGSTNTIGQLAVFNGTGGNPVMWVPRIVVSTGKGTFFYTTSDGAVFNSASTWEPTCFQVVGDELWASFFDSVTNTWGIRKTQVGLPESGSTFGALTTIGDPAHRIQWLAAAENRLYVLKGDGLFAPSLDTTAVDEAITPDWGVLASNAGTDVNSIAQLNGMGAKTLDGNVVFFFGSGIHRYDPLTGELPQFGPELLGLPFPLHYDTAVGFPIGVIPGKGLFTIISIMVDNVQEFHVMRYGGWRHNAQGEIERASVWHGSLHQFAAAQIPLCLFAGDKSPNLHQLIIVHKGTSDPTKLSVTTLPLSNTPNPVGDDLITSYYAGSDAYIYIPRAHGYLPFETKLWSAVGLKGRNCYYTDASNYNILAPEYKVTSTPFVTTGYSAVNSTAATNEVRADPGKRIEASSNVSAQAIDVRINLKKAGSLTNAKSTPVLSAVAAVQKLRLAGIKEMTATVQLADEVSLRDSSTSRNQWEEVKTALERAGNADSSNLENTPLTAVTPFGETVTVFVKNFGVKILDTDDRGDWKSAFFLRMVEVR